MFGFVFVFCLVGKPVATFFRHPLLRNLSSSASPLPTSFRFLLFLTSRCLTYFLRLLQCSFLFVYRENPRTHRHTHS